MLNYHPSIELLIDYSAGTLSLAHSISVSTHLEHCAECRRHVSQLNQVGSHLFTGLHMTDSHSHEPSSELNSLKEKMLNNLSADIPTSETIEQAPFDTNTVSARIPRSLHQFIQQDYDQLEWTRLSSSLRVATLCTDTNGSQVALTRIKAGSHIPTHSHTGEEITLVLEGSFSDEGGIYKKGDFISRNASHKHKPVVTKDAECICLTVLDAPIQFTGFFTRWLNPLLRKHHPNGI
ncbi:anti-sigma factor [Marinomonas agarivorans]|nr:anti-sigma factor [Marinomonas agarivorans]